MERALFRLNESITRCELCPRLLTHCRQIALEKRRAYREEDYWGRPVPSFGDPEARLLVVGLAPAAHGGNRTGRVFTGDSSGDWLYEALHRFGFASQPTSVARDDGLRLRDAWITAVNHCAPPDNKPTLEEQAACRPFLKEELALLEKVRVVVALGRIAFDGLFRAWTELGYPPPRPRPAFGHGIEISLSPGRDIVLIGSFHPSRQNTNTGRLTRPMFHRPFARARSLLDDVAVSSPRRR
jgi:uracil-DNA glycosylase family 4